MTSEKVMFSTVSSNLCWIITDPIFAYTVCNSPSGLLPLLCHLSGSVLGHVCLCVNNWLLERVKWITGENEPSRKGRCHVLLHSVSNPTVLLLRYWLFTVHGESVHFLNLVCISAAKSIESQDKFQSATLMISIKIEDLLLFLWLEWLLVFYLR